MMDRCYAPLTTQHSTEEKSSYAPDGSNRKRVNKHAPMKLSSKRPICRNRNVVAVEKPERGDPRFDTAIAHETGLEAQRKNYEFLESYRKDEIKVLNQSIKQETDKFAKSQLERTVASLQSRHESQKERDRQERVLASHRQLEKQASKDGKIPYYLKAGNESHTLHHKYTHPSSGKENNVSQR